jgi:hypothetical protein
MKKIIAVLFTLFTITACTKKEIVRKPVIIKKPERVLAGVSFLKVPRILKIDQKVNIEISGFFDTAGYVVDNVEIKRKANEISIKIYGKRGGNTPVKTFTKNIILPPQKAGEYDVVVYGKNRLLNDIIWVEEYRDRRR